MKINKLLAAVIVAAFALPVMAQNAPAAAPAPAPAASMAAPADAPAAKPVHKHHKKHHRHHHAKKTSTGKINTGH